MNPQNSRYRLPAISVGVLAVAAGLLIALIPATSSSAAERAAKGRSYVALGDSYTSALGVPKQVSVPCGRSDHNYPSLVAAGLKPKPSSFTDVSCAGATTVELTKPQLKDGSPINAPQFNALKRNTQLVTLQIGGNDAGFGTVSANCFRLGQANPTGSPCRDFYTSGGADKLVRVIKDTASKVGQALKGVHSHSPRAKVLLVGYPTILPDSGNGCFPELPVAAGDLPYLRNFAKSLNTMLAQQAKRHHARFVDTYRPTIGHDVCKPTGTRWVEGVKPQSPAAPLHPNALGEQAMAKAVLAAAKRR